MSSELGTRMTGVHLALSLGKNYSERVSWMPEAGRCTVGSQKEDILPSPHHPNPWF